MKILRLLRNVSLLAGLVALSSAAFAQVSVSITIAPPELPIYEQPECPAPNYIWTPGYWAWGGDGYYWVPGAWVEAPAPGLLWTPGYWGWNNTGYIWNPGYWGPQVGFYGGVNYGYGYSGDGYYGGRWVGNRFSYNTAVSRVNRTVIRNTYVNRTGIRNNNGRRVSFNGGRGGIQARPNQTQMRARQAKRFGPSAAQEHMVSLARGERQNYATVNHGAPPHAALQRPAKTAAEFGRAVPSRGARPGAAKPAAKPTPANRPGAKSAPRTRNEAAKPGARPGAKSEAHPTAHPAAHTGARPAPTSGNEHRPAAKHETKSPAPASNVRRANPASLSESRTPAHSTTPANNARPTNHHETRPAPKPASHPNARPAPKPAHPTNARPASHPENRPASRPEARPAAKPQARPQPRQEARPAARHETKPAPHAAPKKEAKPEHHEEKPHA